MAWACFLPVHGNYPLHLLPALLVMPVGYGMSYPSAYAAATSGVPARQAGLASGLINTAQQMGGAVGLAVISAVAASYTASLTHDSGPQALTSGYHLAMAVAAGLTLLASVIAATVIRVRRPGPTGPAAATGLGTPAELEETARKPACGTRALREAFKPYVSLLPAQPDIPALPPSREPIDAGPQAPGLARSDSAAASPTATRGRKLASSGRRPGTDAASWQGGNCQPPSRESCQPPAAASFASMGWPEPRCWRGAERDRRAAGAHGEESGVMRAALAEELGGIDRVKLGQRPDPAPAAGQALVRVCGAGVGPWDVGFLSGGFPGLALPFVPGQEIAGIVEAAGDGAGVHPGERVYASLFPVGGGFAELALASADGLAPMPGQASFAEAAGLVIGAGTAHEGLVDRGRLQAGETALITAAAGGVGSAAVQIAAAVGARPLGVASPDNHDYVRSLGASEVFDYHAADWVQQVRVAVPGGVDLLLDGAGGQTRDQAIGAVRDGGRAILMVLQGRPAQVERGITGESFAAHINRQRLEALRRLVDVGTLRTQVEAVLPLDQARQALARVAGRHTRGKIVLQVGQ
jgi:NADPH:quinone reductase